MKSRMKAWIADKFGEPLDVLRMGEVDVPSAQRGELLVRVLTATLNKNEIDGIRGIYASMATPAPFVPGFEVYGVVEKAGEGAEHWVGKHVIGMPRGGHGGYAQYAVLPTAMAFEVPASMPAATASAIFWPFHLAWLSLFTRGHLKMGETALIHAGAGGVGSAAIQLAAHAGARVIATAGSDDKLRLCRELGAELAINYQKQDFVHEVLKTGRKVDVALDSIGGDVLEQTWRCLNYGARHLIMGFSSGIQQEDNRPVLLRQPIFGNFSMTGVLMTYVDDQPAADAPSEGVSSVAYPPVNFNMPPRSLGEQIHQQLLDLFAVGRIRPVVGLEVGFSELVTAVDRFDRRETTGRVVIHTTR